MQVSSPCDFIPIEYFSIDKNYATNALIWFQNVLIRRSQRLRSNVPCSGQFVVIVAVRLAHFLFIPRRRSRRRGNLRLSTSCAVTRRGAAGLVWSDGRMAPVPSLFGLVWSLMMFWTGTGRSRLKDMGVTGQFLYICHLPTFFLV